MSLMRSWVPLAIAVTLLCALIYGTQQQSYRQSLNDPQIQIAEDVSTLLLSGVQPAALVPKQQVDIAHSLSPWFAIYDASGTPLASTGMLDGAIPKPPAGVFNDLREGVAHGAGIKTPLKTSGISATGENRLTWEPEDGVRQAIVVTEAGDRFVIAGRNMREVESREWGLETMVALGWLVTLAATLFAVWIRSGGGYDFITYVRE